MDRDHSGLDTSTHTLNKLQEDIPLEDTAMYSKKPLGLKEYSGKLGLERYHMTMAAYMEQLYEQVVDEAEYKSIEAALEVVSLSKDKKLSRIKIQHCKYSSPLFSKIPMA